MQVKNTPVAKYWTYLELWNAMGERYLAEVTCTDIYYFFPRDLEISFQDEYGNPVEVEYDEELFDSIEERASFELHEKKYGKGMPGLLLGTETD